MENEVAIESVQVEEDTYDEAIRLRRGWCPSCQEFTTPVASSVSSGRSCMECFDDRVSGAKHAYEAGFISVLFEVTQCSA